MSRLDQLRRGAALDINGFLKNLPPPAINANREKTHAALDGEFRVEWHKWRRSIAEADPAGDGLAWLEAADWLDEHHYPGLAFLMRCGSKVATYELSPSLWVVQHHPGQDVLDGMAKRFGMNSPRAADLEPFGIDLPGTPNGHRAGRVPKAAANLAYVVRCGLADSVTVPTMRAWHQYGPKIVRHRYAALRWAFLRTFEPRIIAYDGGSFPHAYVLTPRDSWDNFRRVGGQFGGWPDYAIPRALLPWMTARPFDGSNHPDADALRGLFPNRGPGSGDDRLIYTDNESARLDLSRGLIGWALAQGVK